MEKRRFTRIIFNSDIEVRYGGEIITSEIDNLSFNGVFLKTDTPIPVNETVSIKIVLSGSSSELTVNITGRVVRQSGGGMALRFVEMDLDSYIHLKSIISYNSVDVDEVEREFRRFIEQRDDEGIQQPV